MQRISGAASSREKNLRIRWQRAVLLYYPNSIEFLLARYKTRGTRKRFIINHLHPLSLQLQMQRSKYGAEQAVRIRGKDPRASRRMNAFILIDSGAE